MILDKKDCNTAYNILVEKITETLDIHAPEKLVTISPKYIIREPWMTSGLLKSSMTCSKMYKKVLGKNINDPKYLEYIEFRNKYNSLKRITKKKYYIEQINVYLNDYSKLWKVMKELIGKKNDKSSLSDVFIINGEPINDKNLIS